MITKTTTTTRPLWVFDDSEIPDPLGYGDRAVRFFEDLKHPLSNEPGESMALPRFWQRIVKRIYGPRHPDGRRIISRVLISMPRGSRKTTTISAGLGLLHAAGHERVARGLVVLASGSKDQADFGLEEAKAIVETTPRLRKRMIVRGEYLEHRASHARLRLVSSAGDISSSGSTPAAIFIDEFQYFKNRILLKALKTGLVKRPGTLFCITMNAGSGQNGPAWEEYDYARRVALGEVHAPHYLPIIFEPDSLDANPFDEVLWHQTNPGLAEGYPDIEEMRIAASEARHKPAELAEFKQLNLGFWLDKATSPPFAMTDYDDAARDAEGEIVPIDLDTFKGKPCFLAVDLSLVNDLTAVVAAFPDDADGYDIAAWFFCPEDGIQRRGEKDGVPYPEWAKDGFLIATPGSVVDYRAVETKIREICATFDVQEIAFDPKFAQGIIGPLSEDGFPALVMAQTRTVMTPAIRELQRAIMAKRLRTGGNPILRWNASNVELETKSTGLIGFHKGLSRDRIDGAVAMAMAVGRASMSNSDTSIFSASSNLDFEAMFSGDPQ